MKIRIAIESLMCVCILVMLVMVILLYNSSRVRPEFVSKPILGYTKIGYGMGINAQGDTVHVQELSEYKTEIKWR